jgi:transposase
MSAPQVFVGRDVATAQRAMAQRPTGARWAVTNEAPGIAALVTQLQATQPTLSVLEATGGSHRAVVAALAAAAWPLVVVNPRQGRDCANATGQVATTAAPIEKRNGNSRRALRLSKSSLRR